MADQQITKSLTIHSNIIDRIVAAHQKNKEKEIRAQKTNNLHMEEFERRKAEKEQARLERNEKIAEKVIEQHKKLREVIKKKEDHFQKALKKHQARQEERYQRKVKRIRLRRANHEKNIKTVTHTQADNFSSIKNSFYESSPCKTFYEKSFNEEMKHSLSIQKQNEAKGKAAELNRKKLQGQKQKIKQINEGKLLNKLKAQSDQEQLEAKWLKRSVVKLECYLNRSEEQKDNELKEKKRRQEREFKQMQKVKKKRQNYLADLAMKFDKMGQRIEQKNRKCIENKENNIENSLQIKKIRRKERESLTQSNFHQCKKKFNSKMAALYRQDRESWGFLTSLSAYKQCLIEKNVYESSSLALQK